MEGSVDHLFAVDKTTAVLTDLAAVGTTGANPRNHSIAFNPNDPGVIFHRYGSIGFEVIDIAPPHNFSEIGTLGGYLFGDGFENGDLLGWDFASE